MESVLAQYPKPGQVGGALIRKVIAFLRGQGIDLPLTSDILIATSAGSDSIGLAHLLCHYGRRIVDRSKIQLLHVNHGWRGKESDADEEYVRLLGRQWGVPVIVRKGQAPQVGSGKSWEDEARRLRKKIFLQEVKKISQSSQTLVFTAHQADDLAETFLWRLFTGAAKTHSGGVSFQYGVEMRPFLKVRKAEIRRYLEEVGQGYREDSTNASDRFLRARMRAVMMPEAEKIFPRMIEHLVDLALAVQQKTEKVNPIEIHQGLLDVLGIQTRRAHLNLIAEKLVAKKPWCGEIQLPGGWKLTCERKKPKDLGILKSHSQSVRSKAFDKPLTERWILERS